MPVPIYVVDSFASRPFTGNPAGVCLLNSAADGDWMQSVAAEMKHAETAFVLPTEGGFGLRWFTPTIEVDLCGHATLAAAHVLWECGLIEEEEPARFHTKSGTLVCTRHGYGIQMDFPAELASADGLDVGGIVKALQLSAKPAFIGSNRMDILVELGSEEEVRACAPNMDAVATLGKRGVIITATSAGDRDFVSRFFAPNAGVTEDPVTGSAHCCLGPYWAGKLRKSDVTGFQCSERGGTVRVGVRGDRVLLQGHAITVLAGMFYA